MTLRMKRLFIMSYALIGVFVCVHAGNRARAPISIPPQGTPGEIYPEKQVEGHTCGWHSVRSIYTSYDLETDRYMLRERLGVDAKAVPFFASTKGTVHPDILRVLDQDGFQFEHLDLKKVADLHRLHEHFEEGHYALVLINRRENQALHWVVFAGVEQGDYVVVDSLSEEKYSEDLGFLAENVQTTLLLKPSDSDQIGTGKSHRNGVLQVLKGIF